MASRRGFRWQLIVAGVLGVLLLVIALQNTKPVDVYLLFWSVETSQIVVMLVSVAAGLLMGLIALWRRRRRRDSYATVRQTTEKE